jgi:ZIP family zinc transporter
MTSLQFALIPTASIVLGAVATGWLNPSERVIAGMQHLAAGVVFAAAATEVLPQVMHGGSPIATLIGGSVGVAFMLALKVGESKLAGPIGLIAAIGIDLAVDGLVLGLAFVAGERAGVLLAIALTLEVLFLSLTLTNELAVRFQRGYAIAMTSGVALLLPVGAVAAQPVASLPTIWTTGFLSFGLIALLYLVTEELLVEAHEKLGSPFVCAMFFVGFLGLLLIEEVLA